MTTQLTLRRRILAATIATATALTAVHAVPATAYADTATDTSATTGSSNKNNPHASKDARTTPDGEPTDGATPTTTITHDIVSVGGVNVCEFTGKGDADSILTLPVDYEKFRATTISAVRASIPEVSGDMKRADEITGTGITPLPGSTTSPELATITTRVTQALTRHGYNANEIGYALWHLPAATATITISDDDAAALQWIPSVNQEQAEQLIRRPTTDEESLNQRTKRFYHAAAALRSAIATLSSTASIALLNRVDNAALLSVATATKKTTTFTPPQLESLARNALRQCVLALRNHNVRDGAASSKFSADPLEGTSSSDSPTHGDKDRGDLSTGSTELSAGNGTSSPQDIADIFADGSSKDNRKLGVLLSIATVIGAIISAGMRIMPIVRTIQAEIARARAAKQNPAQPTATTTPTAPTATR